LFILYNKKTPDTKRYMEIITDVGLD
jgi:hypothetical protein